MVKALYIALLSIGAVLATVAAVGCAIEERFSVDDAQKAVQAAAESQWPKDFEVRTRCENDTPLFYGCHVSVVARSKSPTERPVFAVYEYWFDRRDGSVSQN